MRSEEFKNLIKTELYQVFLFECRAHIPFMFARHHWFVIQQGGTLSRWEILHWGNAPAPGSAHLFLNAFPPERGISIFPFRTKSTWNSTLIGILEGKINSPAERAARVIEASSQSYPYKAAYRLLGPNSNTYAQWILDQFPEFKIRLSRRSIGKNYRAS